MRRKPALTHRAMMDLLAVTSMARADADVMCSGTRNEKKRAREIYRGCHWISRLAAHWADAHGVDWPTNYKPRTKGGGR